MDDKGPVDPKKLKYYMTNFADNNPIPVRVYHIDNVVAMKYRGKILSSRGVAKLINLFERNN